MNNHKEQITSDAEEFRKNSLYFALSSGIGILVVGAAEIVDRVGSNDLSNTMESGGLAAAAIFGAAALVSEVQATSTRQQLK